MAEIVPMDPDDDEDERVLDDLKVLAGQDTKTYKDKQAPTAFLTLLEQFARYATGDDQLWAEPARLYQHAADSWAASHQRQPGEALIELKVSELDNGAQNSSGNRRLLLNICSDDKPFLVDSITAALTDAGKSILFFVNALIECERDADGNRLENGTNATKVRESIIHAELDPPDDETEVTLLTEELRKVLGDVNIAVADWQSMRVRLQEATDGLQMARPGHYTLDDMQEIVAFLRWLSDEHFAFLGVRRYRYEQSGDGLIFEHTPEHDLGILKDPSRRVLKNTYSERGELSASVEAFLTSEEPILVAKANSKSLVHRRVYLDYIGVKLYDKTGQVVGEDRFIGLFTSDAYNRPASDIPLLRAKVRQVLERAPFSVGGHNQRALLNILETYPRDELFQVDVDTLRESSIAILRLYKRPRIKLIMRRDRFDRFISAFVFIPRDQFNSDRREAIGRLIADTFEGRVSAFYPFFGDASLVRVHYIIGLNPGAPTGPGLITLTHQIRELCRDWHSDLSERMRLAYHGTVPKTLALRYRHAFPAGYREAMSPAEALTDIQTLEAMGERDFLVRAYRFDTDDPSTFRIKLYKRSTPIRLSDLIPTLENFGLSVSMEDGYEILAAPGGISGDGKESVWIHDFCTDDAQYRHIDLESIREPFENAMMAILKGNSEDDGLNALVLTSGLNWREVWMLRTATKYHLQTGIAYSQPYIEETLAKYPAITKNLVAAFHHKFSPDAKPATEKLEAFAQTVTTITEDLSEVMVLDDDRIIRRFINLFSAITRTNYYQSNDETVRPCVALKIDSQTLEEIPEPKPYREIFVSGPMIDGVHLRFGPVARGGLRWSDRKEDFRTEILGLVKAQRVKNAVIVPTGSKGGFVPKKLPQTDDRGVIFEAGRDAYKLFIASLLDVTDNIVDGDIITPDHVVSHDAQDPYLVVAADKGTALFSDTANSIAVENGFWLGDAFASGGSAGYDHKVMGITARGAWEAVKRHFREIGKDIQNEAFTVAGVGDMSGDVFGNGMLLSEHIKLIAAFDHRDIFIDPDPDPATSFAERKRLFELPRSSWNDYDSTLISKGGGVFSRGAKTIALTPEMQTCLGTEAQELSPNALISTILKAQIELFWLGGIGTYFKHDAEENWRVGDRANDPIRINASEMRMKVVGEGANLGLTQRARIAYAKAGGRVNTDAIDNSAGVDSSDHEVNIKILLRSAIEAGELQQDDRNPLLADMTDDVALHVLRHNYDQTRALSMIEASATEDLDAHSRFLSFLEKEGRIDRVVEDLPSQEALEMMAAEAASAEDRSKQGLTRPELSVLLAYTKLWLVDEVIDTNVPDDPFFARELVEYFPEAIRSFHKAMADHRLRREIIATRIANEIVDTCGISFVHEAILVTGASVREIVLCYEAARQIFSVGQFAANVDALDNQISAQAQIGLYQEAVRLLKEQVYRLATDIQALSCLESEGIEGLVKRYREPVQALYHGYASMVPQDELRAVEARKSAWVQQGATEDLSQEVALFDTLKHAIDIVDISRATNQSIDCIGGLFFSLGHQLKLDTLREHMRRRAGGDGFDRRAIRRLMEAVTTEQRQMALNLSATVGAWPDTCSEDWLRDTIPTWVADHHVAFNRYERFIDEINLQSQAPSVSKLSLLSRQLAELSERTAPQS